MGKKSMVHGVVTIENEIVDDFLDALEAHGGHVVDLRPAEEDEVKFSVAGHPGLSRYIACSEESLTTVIFKAPVDTDAYIDVLFGTFTLLQ